MKTMSSADFVSALGNGVYEFERARIVGDIDFNGASYSKLVLKHVVFEGKVSGIVSIMDFHVESANCIYGARNLEFCYAASLIGDLIA
jgi:hypothetical protein